MTKTIAAGLQTQAAAEEQAPIILVKFAGWGGVTWYWANTDVDVDYDGDTYAKKQLAAGVVAIDSSGSPQELNVVVDNTDLGMSTLLAANDPSILPAVTVTAYRAFLDDLSDVMLMAANMTVRSWECSGTAAAFSCSGLSAILSHKLPGRVFSRLCPWVFKGTECTYSSSADYCSKDRPSTGPHEYTDLACDTLSNFDNFGGFLFLRRR
jgi:phage-related protein